MLYTYIDILHRKCYFICRRKKITDKVDEEFSMLRKFKVRNYKNFKETLEFDFTKVSGYAFNRSIIHNVRQSFEQSLICTQSPSH